MNHFHRHAVLFLWLALTLACARLPEYARPRIVEAQGGREPLVTGFAYRPLTKADFRATTREHEERIGANSTIQIRLTADSSFRITRGNLNGQSCFFGSIVHLAFEAVMVPDLSWWNPKIPDNMKSYVLQHEQIHFALTELAARQLTRDSDKWASGVLVIELTAEKVVAELNRQIHDRVDAAMKASLKRQAQFDEETSLFYSPKWQRWWLKSVEDELKKR